MKPLTASRRMRPIERVRRRAEVAAHRGASQRMALADRHVDAGDFTAARAAILPVSDPALTSAEYVMHEILDGLERAAAVLDKLRPCATASELERAAAFAVFRATEAEIEALERGVRSPGPKAGAPEAFPPPPPLDGEPLSQPPAGPLG